MPRQRRQGPALLRRFAVGVFVVLVMMSGAEDALARQGRRSVAFTRPAPPASAQDRAVARLAARRRAVQRRWMPGRNAAGAANEQDSLALVALFGATGGTSWTDSTNWLRGPVAAWFGVSLDDEGRVSAIDLRGNNLSGAIPVELADLTELDTLWLADNGLQGPLPVALTTLPGLTSLSLWGNALTGPMPPELGQLADLKDLLLFHNQLNGPIPPELGQLSKLRRLWLDDNQLTGAIPPELADLAELTELFLDINQLTGAIPPELANLNTLIILSLGDNPLGGAIPVELATMASLEDLWLPNTGLTGTIPTALTTLSTLSTLYLNDNQLMGEIPLELANLRNLTKLWLGNNQLTGEIPDIIGSISNLRDLDLHGNALTGEIPQTLGFLGILEELDLSFNQLTGEIPANLRLQRLQGLDLQGNALTGGILPVLNLPQLTELSLRGNAFSGEIPTALGFLPRLRVVDLGDNAFTGAIPASFDRLAGLQRLVLDANHFETLPNLMTLTALDTVSVARNRLTFEDLEPNVTLAGGNITYVPQDTVATRLTRTATTVTFSVTVGGANNQYQWFREGVAVDGATADTLAVDAAAAVVAYHCEITNTVVPALRLISRSLHSDALPTGFDEASEAPPASFALHANYPNPFNPSTRVAFDVAAPSHVQLTVYDLLGRVVATLVDGWRPAGRHEAVFDAADQPSGLYVYRVEMGDFRAVRAMLLVR